MAVGIQVRTPDQEAEEAEDTTVTGADVDRVSVFVAPAQVNDIVGVGYFGTYVSDILMEQLMLCDRVRLLDRTVLGAQLEESDLTGAYIAYMTAIQRRTIAVEPSVIQVTMPNPRGVNLRVALP